MMAYCSGRCKQFKAIKPKQVGRYASGQKRCNFCEVFVDYNGLKCICCKKQLRSFPRSRKDKETYLTQISHYNQNMVS